MQTNLVTVGDIGRERFTHGYECPCDACSNCEPVYAPKPPDVPFPQTMRYGEVWHPPGEPEGGVGVLTWAWLMAAGCAAWAAIVAFVGWLLSFVVG